MLSQTIKLTKRQILDKAIRVTQCKLAEQEKEIREKARLADEGLLATRAAREKKIEEKIRKKYQPKVDAFKEAVTPIIGREAASKIVIHLSRATAGRVVSFHPYVSIPTLYLTERSTPVITTEAQKAADDKTCQKVNELIQQANALRQRRESLNTESFIDLVVDDSEDLTKLFNDIASRVIEIQISEPEDAAAVRT